jgi:hypothetical protein
MQLLKGDTVVIWDAGNARLTTLGPDLSVVRSQTLPTIGGQVHRFNDGSVLLLGSTGRPGRERLLLFDEQSALITAFMREPAAPQDEILRARRRMAVSPDGTTIAVVHATEYVVEFWGRSGDNLQNLMREPQWLEGRGRRGNMEAPDPQVGYADFDPAGTLWTISWIADERWAPAMEPQRDLYGRNVIGTSTGREHLLWDTMIEAIDLDGLCLLGSKRVDERMVFLLPDGLAGSYREDEMGLPYVDLWRLMLTRSP